MATTPDSMTQIIDYLKIIAIRLAEFYKNTEFEPLENPIGLLTQIDNMVTGLPRLYEKSKKLRDALIGIVGASDKQELEGMEAIVRIAVVPDKDKVGIINAIHTIIETE